MEAEHQTHSSILSLKYTSVQMRKKKNQTPLIGSRASTSLPPSYSNPSNFRHLFPKRLNI